MCSNELRQRAEAEIAIGLTDIGDAEEAGPLHRAAHAGDAELCGALLELGERVDFLDFDEYTPLFYAAHSGHEAAAKLLLDHGADPDSREIGRPSMRRSKQHWTSLHAAASAGHAAVVALLLCRGAAVGAKGGAGETALDLAAAAKVDLEGTGSIAQKTANSGIIDLLQSATTVLDKQKLKKKEVDGEQADEKS